MITLFRLLKEGEVFLEFLGRCKGGTIDTLQLGILLVALVEGARHMGQSEGADPRGIRHMGSCAEVGECTVAVESDLFPGRDAGDDIKLELAGMGARGETRKFAPFPHGKGLFTCDHLALKGLRLGDDRSHLLLDFLKVLRADPVSEIDVVVEAVINRRSGGELRLWPDAEDGICQHVGAGVPDGFELGHVVKISRP